MWRDVRWAVLGGVKEKDGIWNSLGLGARVAKHRQMPDSPNKAWLCILE